MAASRMPSPREQSSRGTGDKGTLGALPLSYAGVIPAAGLEPATTRLRGEVTLVFTTGRIVVSSIAGERAKKSPRPIFPATLPVKATPRPWNSAPRQGSPPC
jgi:hypothetical protein